MGRPRSRYCQRERRKAVNITLILRNGQRIPVPGVSPAYLNTLLGFGCLAGYILKPDSLDVTKLR